MVLLQPSASVHITSTINECLVATSVLILLVEEEEEEGREASQSSKWSLPGNYVFK